MFDYVHVDIRDGGEVIGDYFQDPINIKCYIFVNTNNVLQ